MSYLRDALLVICIILLAYIALEQRKSQKGIYTFQKSLDSLYVKRDTLIRQESKLIEKIRTNEKHYIYISDSIRMLPDSLLAIHAKRELARFDYLNNE